MGQDTHPTIRHYEVAGDFELTAKGREPRFYDRPRLAGEAFYAARREEYPRVVQHYVDGFEDRTGHYETPSTRTIAITTRSANDSLEHIFLDESPEFRAGYETARGRLPDKVVPVEDWTLPHGQQQSPADSSQPMPAQPQKPLEQPAPAAPQTAQPREQAMTAPRNSAQPLREGPAMNMTRLQIDGVDVGRLAFEKHSTPHGVFVDLTALDRNEQPLAEFRGVDKVELTKLLGPTVGHEVAKFQGREGELHGAALDVPLAEIRPAQSQPQREADVEWKDGTPYLAQPKNQQEQAPPRRLELNGQPVERLSYVKRQTEQGMRYEVTAYGTGDRVLAKHPALAKEELAAHLGETAAKSLEATRGRNGSLRGEQLGLPASEPMPQAKATLAQEAAVPTPYTDPVRLVTAIREAAKVEDHVPEIRVARESNAPDAALMVVVPRDRDIGVWLSGRFDPQALKPVLGERLHAAITGPETPVQSSQHSILSMRGIGEHQVKRMEGAVARGKRDEAELKAVEAGHTKPRMSRAEYQQGIEYGRASAPAVEPEREAAAALREWVELEQLPIREMLARQRDAVDPQMGSPDAAQAPGPTVNSIERLDPQTQGQEQPRTLPPRLQKIVDAAARDQATRTQPAQEHHPDADVTVGTWSPPEVPVDPSERRRQELLASLAERFTVNAGEYRSRHDQSQVAFVDRDSAVTTSRNEPEIARAMVDLAEAKGWRGLHLKGTEPFKAAAWMEASVRGLPTHGYEPTRADRERLAIKLRERDAAMQTNRIEPMTPQQVTQREPAAPTAAERDPQAAKAREHALGALELYLKSQNVPKERMDVLMKQGGETLDRLAAQGKVPEVRVFDAQAQRAHTVHIQAPQQVNTPQRSR